MQFRRNPAAPRRAFEAIEGVASGATYTSPSTWARMRATRVGRRGQPRSARSANPFQLLAIRNSLEKICPRLPTLPYHRPTAAQANAGRSPADGGRQRRSGRVHSPLVGMCGRLTEGSPVRHGLSPSCVEVRRDNGRGRHPRGPSRTVCLRSSDGTSNLRAGRRGPHTVAKPLGMRRPAVCAFALSHGRGHPCRADDEACLHDASPCSASPRLPCKPGSIGIRQARLPNLS